MAKTKRNDQGKQSKLFDQQWRIVKQEGKSLCTFSQTPPMVFHHDFFRRHCKWIRALTTNTGIIVSHLSIAVFDSLSGDRGTSVCGHRWTAEEEQEADDSGCEEHDFRDHDWEWRRNKERDVRWGCVEKPKARRIGSCGTYKDCIRHCERLVRRGKSHWAKDLWERDPMRSAS